MLLLVTETRLNVKIMILSDNLMHKLCHQQYKAVFHWIGKTVEHFLSFVDILNKMSLIYYDVWICNKNCMSKAIKVPLGK